MARKPIRSHPWAELRVGSHRLAVLKDGRQTYTAMLAAIRSARSTICLESYIFEDDRVGRLFAEALMERARAGVEVNVSWDAWGSSLGRDFVEELRRAGVRTLAFHPFRLSVSLARLLGRLVRRNHRKILVVDGRVGFTGGVNISDEYDPPEGKGPGWRDTHLRIEGPAVAEMQYRFLRTWGRMHGAPLDERRYLHEARRPDGIVRVIASGFRSRDRGRIADLYLDAFRRARRRIRITNAYFLPTRRLYRALRDAVSRGVDVRLIVAGTTDVPAARLASRAMYGGLLRAGVRIFEWEGRVLHAKTASVDGRWATVGSSNLDPLSMRVNMELNAVVQDREFARALDRMFEEDLRHCREITFEDWTRRPFWVRVAGQLLRLFRRWL